MFNVNRDFFLYLYKNWRYEMRRIMSSDNPEGELDDFLAMMFKMPEFLMSKITYSTKEIIQMFKKEYIP